MMNQGLAATTAASVVLILSGARAEATITTDGLSGRQLKTWKAIVRVVQAERVAGQPLHPTLCDLYRRLESSAHVVRIVILEGERSSAVAGQFWLDILGTDGRHSASITLDLRAIDRALPRRLATQGPAFDRLSRTERQAQVLGHEMAHAAWALADDANLRLAWDAQARQLEVTRLARTPGDASGEVLREAVRESERLARSLEKPALAAEFAINRELRRGAQATSLR